MTKNELVSTADEARANIDGYSRELAASAELQAVMSYARSWHAYRRADGEWRAAPSKFAGYAGNSAAAYLRRHRERDGRRTERALAAWFAEVLPGTADYQDAHAAVLRLFARFGRTPNSRFRVSVLRSDERQASARQPKGEEDRAALLSRVTVDPKICDGRPTIRGMRIRVSDILDLMAAGAKPEEILADYPYLENADISAALLFAAESSDHRLIRVG